MKSISLICTYDIFAQRGTPLRAFKIFQLLKDEFNVYLISNSKKVSSVHTSINSDILRLGFFKILHQQIKILFHCLRYRSRHFFCVTTESAFIPILLNKIGVLNENNISVDVHGLIKEETRNSFGVLILKLMEHFVLRYGKRFVLTSPHLADHIKNPTKILVAPYIFASFSNKNHNIDRSNFLYFGGGQSWQNLDLLVKFALPVYRNKIFVAGSAIYNVGDKFNKISKNPNNQEISSMLFGLSLKSSNTNIYQSSSKICTYAENGLIPVALAGTFEESYITRMGGELFHPTQESFDAMMKKLCSLNIQEINQRLNKAKSFKEICDSQLINFMKG